MDFRHLGFVFILLVVCYLLQCFYSFIPSMNPVLSRYIPMPDGGAEGGLHEGQPNLPPFLLVSLFLARDVLPECILIATDRAHITRSPDSIAARRRDCIVFRTSSRQSRLHFSTFRSLWRSTHCAFVESKPAWAHGRPFDCPHEWCTPFSCASSRGTVPSFTHIV